MATAPNAGLPTGLRKAEDGKASHEEVRYTPNAKDPSERCAVCANFRDGHCSKVVDPISPKGWCMKFEKKAIGATDSATTLAFDKNTVRSFDGDGRMRVSKANISKATVNPYKGEEIPGWEQLGLEKDRVYQMLRAPEELKKGAHTFNSVQLLKKHLPVNADDHQMWDIVGCTGSDAAFDGTYLTNSLSVWTKEGIDFIESGEQRELSCGYHYTPDMTPGIFDGKRYDGVMRDIEGNHVALVEEGRAGHDVVVGDSALSEKDKDMAKPTRLEYLALRQTAKAVNPLLAFDAKVDYSPVFKGLTTANFAQRKGSLLTGVAKLIKGKTIAKDASLEHLAKALDMFGEMGPEDKKSLDESVSGEQHRAMEAAAHGHSNIGIPKKVGEEFAEADKGKKFGDTIRDWAMGKGMNDDDLKALDKLIKDEMPEAALDEDGEEEVNIEVEEGEDADIEQSEEEEEAEDEIEQSEGEEEAEDRRAHDRKAAKDKKAKDAKHAKDRKDAKDRKGAMDKRTITQDDMNKAISAAVAGAEKKSREATEARAFVRPYVGEVSLALDSAESILRSAAKSMKIEGAADVHPSALKQLISLAGRQVAADRQIDLRTEDLAMDEESSSSFDKFFPGASRIGVM